MPQNMAEKLFRHRAERLIESYTAIRGNMKKILLVDDHSDIRRLIRITLGKDFEVMETSDGFGGLEIARRMKPDIIVLDVMMPGVLNGLQVLDAIKSDPHLKRTRVFMVTARGADGYFVKPFSPMSLVADIKNILAG
jgi:DNA-binding response OmpR family regulator